MCCDIFNTEDSISERTSSSEKGLSPRKEMASDPFRPQQAGLLVTKPIFSCTNITLKGGRVLGTNRGKKMR